MRRGPRTSGSWKFGVLLLFVGLLSFFTLAKNSYNLPKSSPIRRVASASKMCVGRSMVAMSPFAARVSEPTFARYDVRTERFTRKPIEPPVEPAAWLEYPSLRSPPSSL
ncbi:MAG TPA: hypothetical protein VMT20_27380 [Terriglobia bacterium]|nr:hypothetical protein [Terriglobia bacterium]